MEQRPSANGAVVTVESIISLRTKYHRVVLVWNSAVSKTTIEPTGSETEDRCEGFHYFVSSEERVGLRPWFEGCSRRTWCSSEFGINKYAKEYILLSSYLGRMHHDDGSLLCCILFFQEGRG